MTKHNLRDIETALKDELRRMRDRDIARFPGEADMERMFKQDYLDGLNVASLIGIGRFEQANDKLSWMDTGAREAVAEAIVRVDKEFFVDCIMGEDWKHPDQWCT